MGTGDRLTAFHRAGESEDTIAPDIQLTDVMLYNEKIAWQNFAFETADGKFGVKDTSVTLGNEARLQKFHFKGLSKWYGIPVNLSLAYNNNNLTFGYIGTTIQSPKKVRYQYLLEGFEENWTSFTDRTEATYGNLPHGSYIFKVKAINSDGTGVKNSPIPLLSGLRGGIPGGRTLCLHLQLQESFMLFSNIGLTRYVDR